MNQNTFAFIFPGQGAQYVGMGREFFDAYAEARALYEEADDILHFALSKVIFEGPESTLKETRYCQAAIYVTSLAILQVLKRKSNSNSNCQIYNPVSRRRSVPVFRVAVCMLIAMRWFPRYSIVVGSI